KNVILIMTSNVGAKETEGGAIGLSGSFKGEINSSKRDQALKNLFTPEFRNRLDSIISFNKLALDNIEKVVNKFLMELENQLSEKKVELEVTNAAKEWLGKKGYDEKLGARPISRIIDEKIKRPLAHEILFGRLENGGNVIIDLKDDELDFKFP